LVEEGDLVLGLDHAGPLEELLAVHHLEPRVLEREQDRRLADVQPHRLVRQPPRLQLHLDLARDVLRPARLRDAGAREPGHAGAAGRSRRAALCPSPSRQRSSASLLHLQCWHHGTRPLKRVRGAPRPYVETSTLLRTEIPDLENTSSLTRKPARMRRTPRSWPR